MIGGQWRRLRLKVPAASTVRPTPDRIRETLFNWLEPTLSGARCLDLFAGTGVLGIEALSRGAAHVSFVERDRVLVNALEALCTSLECDAQIFEDDAFGYLRRGDHERYDLIFVDPPYDCPIEPILSAVEPVLARSGLIYIERPVEEGFPDSPSLEWYRQTRAGGVCFGLARRAVTDRADDMDEPK